MVRSKCGGAGRRSVGGVGAGSPCRRGAGRRSGGSQSAAGAGTWPSRAHRADTEDLHAVLAVAERLLVRGAVTTCEKAPDGHVLESCDIAIGTAHRIQAHRIRALLAREYPVLHGITVETANRLQGAEFRITIVLHPLSDCGDASAFHLEAGRLGVLTSRHRHACIVVARAGIPELLDAHRVRGTAASGEQGEAETAGECEASGRTG
ncbi:AAA domain-containing protein [Streptomyces sp. AA1529]|uniref:AAA domain-containing protein n=1 Tax=Streptomyces sp. AA1529 TaxID=1203257 RepID=UPI003EB6D474